MQRLSLGAGFAVESGVACLPGYTGRRRGRAGSCLPESYVLVIAEKPKAARKIAEVLSGGRARWCRGKGRAGYWVFEFSGRPMVVASAVGHLFGLHTGRRGFPVFEYTWRPLWQVDRSAAYTRPYYELLSLLSGQASLYVNACDYDIEGSVIGFMVIKKLGDLRRARRARFSSLTRSELMRAFRSLGDIDYDMVEAGLARHELDWLWGINVSRALMESVRAAAGRRVILSAGRVQSPTLAELVRREIARRTYVPLPFFRVVASIRLPDGSMIRTEVARFDKRADAAKFAREARTAKTAHVRDVAEKSLSIPPPYPFNLPDLQAEAARLFGYSPYYTQKVAEDLYLEGLISYPRTNSQKLPPSLDVMSILKGLGKNRDYCALVDMLLLQTGGVLKPRNGPKDDPAHPAIHPTGVLPKAGGLDRAEARIYDLIVKRFLSTFARPAIYRFTRVELDVAGRNVTMMGKRLEEEGWLALYKPYASFSERVLPKLSVGQTLPIASVNIVKSLTRPPEPYTKIKLVKWMESVGIGTEATRARIVELLVQRGYAVVVRGKMTATDLGLTVTAILEKYFSDLVSVELTRFFEKKLAEIRSGSTTRKEVIMSAKKVLAEKLTTYKEKFMEHAGRELAEALGALQPRDKCLVCGRRVEEGNLCRVHLLALEELVRQYPEWRKRLAELEPHTYLAMVAKSRYAGEAIRELLEKHPGLALSRLAADKLGK